MRIAIDARELVGRPTGVGRYLAELLRAWGDLAGAHAHEFILCAPEHVPLPAPQETTAGLRVEVMSAAGSGTMWEQFTLPRLVARARADVLADHRGFEGRNKPHAIRL